MRRYVVPGRQDWVLGVSNVKNAAFSVCAGLLLAAASTAAFAGDRPASKQYIHASASGQSVQNASAYDRKCMTLPCGTRWCYNVRR
jgi:hypothetical protein